MIDDKSQRFWARLAGAPGNEALSLATLCQAVVELLAVSGASVVLMSQGSTQVVASVVSDMAKNAQNLEYTLGEGPAVEAFAQGRPVMVDDLSAFEGQWPQFTPAALGAGLRAIYALPLQIGAIKLGVLTLYRDQPGSLKADDYADATLVADLVTQLVLVMQSQAASDSLAWALESTDHRAVVHQATGVIAVQLACRVDEALVRLRGYAFAAERPVVDVADDVVRGWLRFDEV